MITTVTQLANMYWDLVAAYDDEQVKSRSLDFANQTLEAIANSCRCRQFQQWM